MYPIIEPPINRPPDELTRAEAKQHFEWFVHRIPERLGILKVELIKAGVSQSGIELSPGSLSAIGKWFGERVTSRSFSKAEKATHSRTPRWFRPIASNTILTELTLSYCTDLGMYFGEVMRKAYPVEWILLTRNKREVYYQHPVLSPFKNGVVMDPVHLIRVLANQIVDGKASGSAELSRLYSVWSEYVED